MDIVDNVNGEFRETFHAYLFEVVGLEGIVAAHANPELTTAHLLLFYYHFLICFKPKVCGIFFKKIIGCVDWSNLCFGFNTGP
jgi:hypothetical protein